MNLNAKTPTDKETEQKDHETERDPVPSSFKKKKAVLCGFGLIISNWILQKTGLRRSGTIWDIFFWKLFLTNLTNSYFP